MIFIINERKLNEMLIDSIKNYNILNYKILISN